MKETLIAILTAALLLAQNPQDGSGPASKAPTKFSITTQLVTIGLTAKDKDGKAITGLTAADFVVSEDGKKQKLASCDYQHLDNNLLESLAPAPAAPAESKTPNSTPATAPTQPAETRYKDRRLLILYFDMTAMPLEDQMRAQESALRFVRSEMTAADTVSVMSFSSQLKLLQEFTNDRDLLVKAINSLIAGEGSDLNTTADDASVTNAAYTADDTEFNIFNADRKLVALQSAIKSMGSFPEKKGLMYFSSGFTKSGVDNEAQMRATTNAAIRYNVALFPVDARGLSATALTGDASKPPASASAIVSNIGAAAIGKLQASQETLHSLAADTGGKELINSNDLAAGIVEAQKEISDYYLLTYASSNQALDGSFRRIKVELANNKTAHLEYRAGYFANKEFKQFTAADRESRLQEALLLGDPITDLPLQLELNYFRLAQDRYFVPLEAKIPGSEIDLAKHGDMESARLDFVGQVTDSKGKVVKQVRDNLEVKLKGVSAAELASKNLAYDSGFELPPGVYTVKFLARENVTGKMGTFETKLNIPDLAAEKSWLPISSVVLSGQIEAQSAAIANAGQDKKTIADHPLIRNGNKIVPSVTRAFKRSQTLYVYLEAFEPETQQSLQTTVSFYRGKTKVFETPVDVSHEAFKAQAKVQPIQLSIPLVSLDPGRYTCQISVIDAQSQKVAFWRAPVAVLQ